MTVEIAEFFTVKRDGVSHLRTFVLEKHEGEAAAVTMRDVEAVLNEAPVQVQLLKL